jgi:hypothetical protein
MDPKLHKKALDKSINPDYEISAEDLRFATNGILARYRALRLNADVIIDLCSGVGVQAIAFAKVAKKVIAVEIDGRKVECARKNAEIEGLANIEFIIGDVLDESIIKKVASSKPDIIFCDPERLPEEQERSLDTIKPDIPRLITRYAPSTQNIVVELPPQIKTIEKIDIATNPYEKEYASVDGHLNRLTLYFGDLKRAEVSAVSLPSGERIEEKFDRSDKASRIRVAEGSEILEFIYEIDDAILKAELLPELLMALREKQEDNVLFILSNNGPNQGKILLTSKILIKTPFLFPFKVLCVCDDAQKTVDELKKIGAGKVILKKSIDPKEYWGERNRYEMHLSGTKTVHLFSIDGKECITEKML